MIPRVMEAWRKNLTRLPADPDNRLLLAQDVLRNGSLFCSRRTIDTTNTFAAADSAAEQTLVSIPKIDNWVTVLESFNFRYENPGASALIDAYYAMLKIANAEVWQFPRFTFASNLDADFGPQKLLNGPYVVIREQNVSLVLNPGQTAVPAPAMFQVLTRFEVRYEPQWLMELLGIVEPADFPDKGPSVLGGR
jgi:hypothetical protein